VSHAVSHGGASLVGQFELEVVVPEPAIEARSEPRAPSPADGRLPARGLVGAGGTNGLGPGRVFGSTVSTRQPMPRRRAAVGSWDIPVSPGDGVGVGLLEPGQ
jgi:hypothetical protein